MTILGLVTARGGSKSIPGKNLRPLAGKPLIAYTIEAARASGALDRLVITTDDPAIADTAVALGCEVPFLRPAALARDDAAHLPVVQHAVDWLAEHEAYRPDAVLILQPTSPLRTADDIRAAVALLERSGADSVVGVSEVPRHYNPMRTLRVAADGTATLFVSGQPVRARINRRQDMPTAWTMNGAIYLVRTAALQVPEPSLYGDRSVVYEMPPARGISIDDPEDWAAAERALQQTATTHG